MDEELTYRHRVDVFRWEERWQLVKAITSGSQGIALKVRDASGNEAFLKELRSQNISERRGRMYQEIASIERLDIVGVPRLVETNAHHYLDPRYRLYIAMEFIEGSTLAAAVPADRITPGRALNIALAICDIVREAHARGIFHRDIKPDNVMLREVDGKVFLVDFGIAHLGQSDSEIETELNQEVGNRFLRLPELRAGGSNKHDPRSDATLCVGLLFFMLARIVPRVLEDEKGNRPHQRDLARATLNASGFPIARLLAIFDRGFSNDIGHRFQSIDSLLQALEKLRESEHLFNRAEISIGSIGEKLMVATGPQNPMIVHLSQLVDSVLRIALSIFRELIAVPSPDFQLNLREPSGFGRRSTESVSRDVIVFREGGYEGRRFVTAVEASSAGSEVILSVWSPSVEELVLRMPREEDLSESSRANVRNLFLKGLARMVDPKSPRLNDAERDALTKSACAAATKMADGMSESVLGFVASNEATMILVAAGTPNMTVHPETVLVYRDIGVQVSGQQEAVALRVSATAWIPTRTDDASILVDQSMIAEVRKGNTMTQNPAGASLTSDHPLRPSPEDLWAAIRAGIKAFSAE